MVCSHKRGKVSWENAQRGKATWSLLVMEDIRANYLLDVTKTDKYWHKIQTSETG